MHLKASSSEYRPTAVFPDQGICYSCHSRISRVSSPPRVKGKRALFARRDESLALLQRLLSKASFAGVTASAAEGTHHQGSRAIVHLNAGSWEHRAVTVAPP